MNFSSCSCTKQISERWKADYQMARGDRETDKQVGRQTRDIYVGRISGQTKKEEPKIKQERWILWKICEVWFQRNSVQSVRGMVVRRREERTVGREQGISGRESKTSLCWEEEEGGGGVGAEKEIWKQRRKQHMQEEARALVGVDFLGQTHKPKGAFEKTSEMHRARTQHSNT